MGAGACTGEAMIHQCTAIVDDMSTFFASAKESFACDQGSSDTKLLQLNWIENS
eukprot:COSAG01_NODE_3439_length_6096_cov_8.417375_8_plen_54_part_00